MSKFDSIEQAVADIAAGRMVIVVDDEDRENEGDLVMAASKITAEAVNFMAKEGRGLVCVPLEEGRADYLDLPSMVLKNTDRKQTNFTVSVDVREGTTTGISMSDRAKTIQALSEAGSNAEDFLRPGHIFPLRGRKGGVLVRAGHTEAAMDLCRLAGLPEVGVLCEIIQDNGEMARVPALQKFAEKHGLLMVTIQDLIAYRRQKEKLVEFVSEATMPTEYGEFRILVYRSLLDGREHMALVMGDVGIEEPVLTRVHSECLTGDVFGSLRCDCGPQLDTAMKMIGQEGRGVLLYMRQEGRGIGLGNKVKAYGLQDGGLDTVEANAKLGFKADLREYGIGAQILVDLGLKKIHLLTNNPKKIVGLGGYGLEVAERLPLEMVPVASNRRYLSTKKSALGHLLKHV